jgi:hypothetical protein
MRPIRDGEKILMENIIDGVGFSAFVDAIAGICLDKAEHIVENWQDKQTASHWTAAATDLQDLAQNKNYL